MSFLKDRARGIATWLILSLAALPALAAEHPAYSVVQETTEQAIWFRDLVQGYGPTETQRRS